MDAGDAPDLRAENRALRARLAEARASGRELTDLTVHLTAILDAAVDGIFAIDATGTVVSMNHAACKLFGYAREEVVGRNVTMLIPPHDRDEDDEVIANLRRAGMTKILGLARQ
jgi:PAS domain S-box-containing protein